MAGLLLGLGIAASVVTFTVADSLLYKPLLAEAPEQLVRAVTIRPRIGPRSYFSFQFRDALRKNQMFTGATASMEFTGGYTDEGRVERVLIGAVDEHYFEVFGVKPELGRTEGGAVLSNSYWKSRYGGRADVLGRKVTVRGKPFEIVGVMPAGFNGATVETAAAVRVPLTVVERPEELGSEVVARLAATVDRRGASDAAYALYGQSLLPGDRLVDRQQFDLEDLGRGTSRLREQMGTAAKLAWVGAGMLLVLACINLSGLMLSRMMQKRQELAVRLALGASRARLLMLVAAECAVIGLIGTAIGVGLAAAVLEWLPAVLPPVRMFDTTTTSMALRLTLDWRVIGFAALAGTGTLLVMGLAPAWQAMGVSADAVLRESKSSRRLPGWGWVVAAQTALCTVLLMNASVVDGTLRKLASEDTGFAKSNLVVFTVDRDLAGPQKGEEYVRTIEAWQRKVRDLPGVQGVALAQMRLFRGSGIKTTMAPAGGMVPASDFMNTSIHAVSPEYFATVGQRLIEGRLPHPGEKNARVVNEAFRKRFGEGHQFGFGAGQVVKADIEVVGVVSDAKYRGMREAVPPTIYGGLDADATRMNLIVRTQGQPEAVIGEVRAALRSTAPWLVAEDVATMEQDIAGSLWNERAMSTVSRTFAVLAAGITLAGIFGMMSQMVTARRRELAIRTAVGARRDQLTGMATLAGLRPVAMGLIAGLGLSWSLESLASQWLAGSSFHDLAIIVTVAALQLAGGVIACLWPAWRAAGRDPWNALRAD